MVRSLSVPSDTVFGLPECPMSCEVSTVSLTKDFLSLPLYLLSSRESGILNEYATCMDRPDFFS